MRISNPLPDEAVLGEIGRRIAALRVGRRMTQGQLAATAGLAKRTVERLEAGGPVQAFVLIRCLRALSVLDAVETLLPPIPSPTIDVLKLRNGQQLSVASSSAARAARPWSLKD